MALARLVPRPSVRPSPGKRKGTVHPQVIAFANQKGGVAKTTTTLNLGVAFAESGLKVLCIDLDPQGNLTMSQGMNPDAIERSMFDVLVHRLPIEEVIEPREADEILRENFGDLVYQTRIRKTIRFAEAPVKGSSVLAYEPGGEAAQMYRDLAKEVLRGEKARQHA